MMHRIALATEPILRQCRPGAAAGVSGGAVPGAGQIGNIITEATTHAACHLAEEVGAKMIVVASVSGDTALTISKQRSFVPILGVSDSESTLRRMCLFWGIIPHFGAPVGDNAKLLGYIGDWGRESGYFNSGDRLVLVLGTGISASRHNAIVVHQVE
jgi:pyruvate kinase